MHTWILKIQPIPILFLKIVPVLPISSVKTILVSNTDFFGTLLVSIFGKSQYIGKNPTQFFEMCIS